MAQNSKGTLSLPYKLHLYKLPSLGSHLGQAT